MSKNGVSDQVVVAELVESFVNGNRKFVLDTIALLPRKSQVMLVMFEFAEQLRVRGIDGEIDTLEKMLVLRAER